MIFWTLPDSQVKNLIGEEKAVRRLILTPLHSSCPILQPEGMGKLPTAKLPFSMQFAFKHSQITLWPSGPME